MRFSLLATSFYRLCDWLECVICQYERHKAATQPYVEALERELFSFYAGPLDGERKLYAGLIYRLRAYPEGAYLFDGQSYRWVAYQ